MFMKSLFYLVLASIIFTACSNDSEVSTDIVSNPNTASENPQNLDLPVMKFEQELFEFGQITQGEKVNFNFKFQNTGQSDLVITSAKGSCGCTVPKWPKHPIAPGESAEINVVFNSDGKSGKQHKTVEIIANTQPSNNVVAISGEVIAPSIAE